ncbi:capsular polysaccharide biosynthesis protein [Desulfitispora alkaliphila]|uniref:glycosyltransferase family 61 protein n=1 Tax=Desulfitispora alkaliphila TaxID=622674 RepID=UPI003D1C6D8E
MNIDLNRCLPPNGLYYKTVDYHISKGNTQSLRNVFYEFEFEHKRKKRMPKSIYSKVPWEFIRSYFNQPPNEFVSEITQGRVVGHHGYVITSNNKLLWDASIQYGVVLTVEPEQHPIFQYENLPEIEDIDERILALTFCASQNYYHWMFDVLPRIKLLSMKGITVDKYIINRNGIKQPFQDETLNLLGIDSDKIIEADENFHLRVSKLVVASSSGYNGQMPKWACDFIRNKFLNKSNKFEGYEKIYISRQHAKYRNILNEESIRSILKKLGFKVVILERMSVLEQAELFNKAKVIVSAHGAGLTNLVFCNANTKVIEIFSPRWVVPLYWVLSNHVDIDYYFLLGEGKRPPDFIDVPGCFDHIMVDIRSLKKTLKLAKVY